MGANMASEAWTVRRLLEWTEDFLRKKGVEGPRLEAQILLAHALNCPKIDLYVRHDEEPAEEKRAMFREMIRKRAEGMPVAYLVGYREFYSLPFAVTPAVLIPRPETETLVLQALGVMRGMESPRVLDVGTGSGCVAITLAKQHKTARITAVDTSSAALEIALGNAKKHGLADRVTFVEGDLFAPVAGQMFDVIVSNPPYIADAEFANLDKGVRDFEPRTALAGGPEGLSFYRRIAAAARAHLSPGGAILVEIGATQGPAVRELLESNVGPGRLYTDSAGRPRVVMAKLLPVG
jgi:release factor glutamine methyltransferase